MVFSGSVEQCGCLHSFFHNDDDNDDDGDGIDHDGGKNSVCSLGDLQSAFKSALWCHSLTSLVLLTMDDQAGEAINAHCPRVFDRPVPGKLSTWRPEGEGHITADKLHYNVEVKSSI